MKKIYKNVDFKVVTINSTDVIATSVNATLDGDGITGDAALSAGRRGFDDYEDF